MEKYFFSFDLETCETADIATLKNLLCANGYNIEENSEPSTGEMGIDWSSLVLLVPLLPDACKEIASVIKMWLSNRHLKMKLEDKKTGRVIEIDSASGKIPSQEILEQFFTVVSD